MERRFCVGDVEAVLTSATASGLAGVSGYYDQYPSGGGSPDLLVQIVHDPEFRGPSPAVPPPEFASREVDNGLELWRENARGRIEIPDDPHEPVRSCFTLAVPTTVEAAIRISMSVALPRRGGIVLHSSAVASDSFAHVFTGRSGAGKSTISNLLAEASPAIVKLADELLVLRERGDGWRAFVAPFHGIQGLPHGQTHRVAATHFISHSTSNHRERVTETQALAALLKNVLVYAGERKTAASVLKTCARFVSNVPCFTLGFRRSPDVARLLGLA